MTPAVLFLAQHAAPFTLHQYDCTTHDDFGAHAALVPASNKVNLKRLAKAAGVKKLEMMAPVKAERLTGYKVGGISPFAQKKTLPTVVDISALQYSEILVSGGKRGLL